MHGVLVQCAMFQFNWGQRRSYSVRALIPFDSVAQMRIAMVLKRCIIEVCNCLLNWKLQIIL